MSATRGRSFVVALLAAVVGFRIAGSEPANAVAARVAADPGAAIRHAVDGWTVEGTLGDASAAGLRELPLALFHWLGQGVGLGPELLHPAWRILVLVLAVLGAVRLARAIAGRGGAEEPPGWTPWVAAAFYACGPVLVTTTALSPVDGLAAAAMPWVLAPLLRREDPGWRDAAASAAWLGVAGAGGLFWAVAALLAGVVAALPRSRSELVGFLRRLVLALLASVWWIGAGVWELVHATDVTEVVERSGLRASLAAALGEEEWGLAGLVLVTLWPAAMALLALLLRPAGAPLRTIGGLLALGVVGLVVVTGGAWTPLVVAPAATGTAAPYVAPVLALLGLAALVAWQPVVDLAIAQVQQVPLSAWEPRRTVVVVVTGLVVLGAVLGTAATGQEPDRAEAPAGEQEQVWEEVGSWSSDAPPGRVLVLPATQDRVEPVVAGALAGRPWIARDGVPVSGGPATRALDDLVGRLSRGVGGDETAAALHRLGIRYVLLRDDLPAATDRERPVGLVRAALDQAGATRTAVFGSAAGDTTEDGTASLVDYGLNSATPQVELWEVEDASAAWEHEDEPLLVAGDAGSTNDLAAAGVLGDRPVTLTGEGGDEPVDVVSDAARRTDVDQRRATDPYGPLLGADEGRTVVPSDAAPSPTGSLLLTGATSVTASSSAADLDGTARRVGAHPLAAVDGNAYTVWQSRRGTGIGAWWQVEFEAPVPLDGTTIQTLRNAFSGHAPTRIRVTTDGGHEDLDVPLDGRVTLTAQGSTEQLRITALAFSPGGEAAGFGISEVSVPGVTVEDRILVEGPPSDAWLLAARPGSRAQCVPGSVPPARADEPPWSSSACLRGLSVDGPDTGALDRVVVTDRDVEVSGRAWVRAASTGVTASLVDRLAEPSVRVTGSSTAVPDLVARPQAAADGDETTAWRPTAEDPEPSLTLTWDEPSEVTGLRLVPSAPSSSSVPTRVRVVAGDGAPGVEAEVQPDGTVTFPPVRTASLTVTFLETSQLVATDAATGAARPVPLAVAELEVVGGPAVRYRADEVTELDCGSGPVVTVGVEEHATAVTASARQLAGGAAVPAVLCSRPELVEGENPVSVEASFSWTPLGLLLSSPAGALGAVDEPGGDGSPRALEVDLRPGRSTVDLAAGGTMALAVPAGKGWTVTADGAALPEVTVDGWAQAWAVPAGAGEVTMTYSAAGSLRLVAGLGAGSWLLVLLLAGAPKVKGARARAQAIVGRSTQA